MPRKYTQMIPHITLDKKAWNIVFLTFQYRICDIENQKIKIKQRPQVPQISFAQDRDSEKQQRQNSASAICVLAFRGRGQVRGGLLQWKVNARLSFSLSLPFFNFFHNFIVFIIILNKFKKLIECSIKQ